MAPHCCPHLIIVHYGCNHGNKAYKDLNVGNETFGQWPSIFPNNGTCYIYMVAIDTGTGQRRDADNDKVPCPITNLLSVDCCTMTHFESFSFLVTKTLLQSL